MPIITYDDRSYILDNRRIWLCSGSIHYFRTPHQLWRDRLLKAKRAGLNCVETYVAWNVHETQEGRWDFTGDHDLVDFVRQAQSLGLYVILRPGPYICAEWDFGGLPAWLATKSGMSYRTANASFMHYFDKYFAQVLPRLAEYQITRGGNIVLIQNENEYFYTTMPDRLNYCQFINQLFRRAGFDIPIITCNFLSEPQVPDTVECVNGWGREVQQLKQLRLFQPGKPMLMSEFWDGNFDYWGGPHNVKPATEYARRALEAIGCGGQINYYMWHGGTNFAFWGSRLAAGEATYQTTSYDYDAPLAEGGGLTKKYYTTKLVNMLASYFGQFLAQGRMDGPGVSVHDNTGALNLIGPLARLAVITNNGRDDIRTARISTAQGVDLDVPLEPLGAVAIPTQVQLAPDCLLDYANLMPLGVFGEGNLALHAPAGWEARISINGKEVRAAVPAGQPVLLEHRGQRIVLMSSELAQRAWAVEGHLVIGPDFVGEGIEDITSRSGQKQYAILSPQGQITHRKVKPHVPRQPVAPKLGAFARLCVAEEPISHELAWERLDRPKDLAALGILYGYGWCRLEVDSSKQVRRQLFLPDCEDRATIYLNGQQIGVWGRGPGASRKCLPATFKRGPNRMVFLLDNLGRINFGPKLGENKGIFGPVWEAKPLALPKFKLKKEQEFTKRLVPRMYSHMINRLAELPMWLAEVSFNLSQIQPVHVNWTNLPYDLAVTCNGRQSAFMPNSGGFGQVMLHNDLQKGHNRLSFLLWGEVQPKALENVRLHLLMAPVAGSWSYRRWRLPEGEGRLVGKGLPAWYRCHFTYRPTNVPLFLRISGARKGQVYLNGHNLGRYWTIGPQEYYYLPEPWLAEENALLIFDEQGETPSGSRLEFRPLGPYRQ